jgi:hypothetical protein
VEVQGPALNFPTTFCCNCGSTDCAHEIQDTQVSRFIRLGGDETTFHLPVPVCAACKSTTRRRPVSLVGRLLVLLGTVGALFLLLLWLGSHKQLPVWVGLHVFSISCVVGFVLTFFFYRLRRARPPKTSFYQPVRVRSVKVRIADVAQGQGRVVFMKLSFTNPEYLELFRNANSDAIAAGQLAAVRA